MNLSDSGFNKPAFWSQAIPATDEVFNQVNKCMLIIPHPDDESLACAGLVSILKAKGVVFKFILTTDGSQSHTHSVKFPQARLTQVRHDELLNALNILGFDNADLLSYRAKDSAMPSRGENGFSELAEKLTADLLSFNPDLILVPYELDPHRDHRASWQLLMAALEKAKINRPRIWEYPIWLYQNASPEDIPKINPGELKLVNISRYLELKKACIYAHASQTTALIDDDPMGFRLSEEMISNFTIEDEFFLERQKLNPEQSLSADYFDALYLSSDDPWSFTTSNYEKDKYDHTLSSIPDRIYERALEIGCSIGVFTAQLAKICKHLTAIDLSENALKIAKGNMAHQKHVDFYRAAIPQEFPAGQYDLIILSEVGYYLLKKDLLKAIEKIDDALLSGGVLVLVHWTHFVVDYPLTGDDVHDCFKQLNYISLKADRTQDYRLDVYQKR
ncbi:bifunctional PIG-L family deacetylase/class I SAM-dependent methyltransferase [Pedobacter aquatilis]|uniref:bifunctional PIG-L family deacetylase/class I SAM-dependent methyltransferase n=1 Tax=Pedobacter aquatilis TaxID=351343 RepID=UPI0025B4739A|nr:bifunctional PIG-L family deacetylase/class I SAM-dependent methyltransferase [Pedobacter aquatilis]MDN3586235.1 bifunctional PIG-L family deacetylase/class I SAM-dependent methyltransferase [Pedobacter aquatilis]